MAISVTTDLVDGNLSEATTNYAVLGTWGTAIAASPDTYVQASNTVGGRVSAATGWAHTTLPGTTVNLTDGRHVFQWLKCISIPQLDTKANGGLGITISSDATPTLTGSSPSDGPTNSKTWYVGGLADPLSGWVCYVVNPNGTADLTLGSPTVSGIQRIGIRAKVLGVVGGGSVKPVNIVFDATRYGTGLTYTGDNSGTPGTFADILATAMTDTSKAWGILTFDNSIYFCAGKFNFGKTDQSAVTGFKSTGQTLIWRNFPVAATFYAWNLRGVSGFKTTWQFGDYSSGLTSNGNVVKGAGDPTTSTHAVWTLDVDANSICKIYASQLSELYRTTLRADSDIRGTTFKNFGDITANGATIDNCTFQDLRKTAPISATYGLVVTTTAPTFTNNTVINCATFLSWNVNADTNVKLNGTSFVSGGTGHAMELGSNTPSAITLTDVGFSGYGGTPGSNLVASSGSTDAAIYNNSGKEITINISGGNTPAIRNGAGASTIVNNTVNLTLTGMIDGSDISILTAGTTTERVNIQENSGTTYNYSYSYVSSDYVDVGVFKAGYVPFYTRSYLLGSTNGSLPISQVIDRAYLE